MTYIESLQEAIENSAGCRAVHLRTDPVTELFQGKIVWQGNVEIFELKANSKAKLAYGWGIADGKVTAFVTVLGAPPVNNSNDAVKAHIVDISHKKMP